MDLSLILLFLFTIKLGEGSECETNGPVCVDQQHFQQCTIINGQYQLVGNVTACQNGNICDHSSENAICRTVQLASFGKSGDAPACKGSTKHPSTSSCYEYYECKKILLWWTAELKTCPEGLAFDSNTTECAPLTSVQCESRSTTTTTTSLPPPIDEPQCKGPTKHPALFCHQYFECDRVLFRWQPKLKTCPRGQAFDISKESCVCAGLVNCALPETELKCEGPGNHHAFTCHEYYECKKLLWGWEPKLKQCPVGTIYDKSTCHCVPNNTAKCFDETPTCHGYWLYPAAEKNQFYECILSETGVDWLPQLRTCPKGTIFLTKFMNCVAEWLTLFI